MGYRPITDLWFLARPKVKYYGAYPNGFLERARALLDNWNEARAKFVKVFPNEYKRALGDMAAAEAKPVAAAKPKKAAVKS